MADLILSAKQTFLDMNGDPLSGGFVYTYVPNTSTPVATYQDIGATISNTFPVVLDQAGRAMIWVATGTYRQVVTDQFGAVQWDQITESGADIHEVNGPFTVDGGPFTVNGNSVFNGHVQVNGNEDISGHLGVGGGENIVGGLTVDSVNDTGAMTVGGGLAANGGLGVNGGATINGSATVNGGLTSTGSTNLAGGASIEGSANITGGLTVDGFHDTGAAQVDGGLTAGSVTTGYLHDTGDAQIDGSLTVNGNEDIHGSLHVFGNGQIDGNLNVNGTITGGGIGGGGSVSPSFSVRIVTSYDTYAGSSGSPANPPGSPTGTHVGLNSADYYVFWEPYDLGMNSGAYNAYAISIDLPNNPPSGFTVIFRVGRPGITGTFLMTIDFLPQGGGNVNNVGIYRISDDFSDWASIGGSAVYGTSAAIVHLGGNTWRSVLRSANE